MRVREGKIEWEDRVGSSVDGNRATHAKASGAEEVTFGRRQSETAGLAAKAAFGSRILFAAKKPFSPFGRGSSPWKLFDTPQLG